MFRRSCILLCILSLLVCAASAQRRSGSAATMPSNSSLRVRVVLANQRPLPNTQFQVVLMDSGGTPLKEGFTDNEGRASFSNLQSGMYRLSVSGPAIEETTAQFQIQQFEGSHFEYVRVKPIQPGTAAPAAGASVSAASLRVPEKALKEFTKGNQAVQHGDLQQAEQHYRKAAEIYPDYSAADSNLGVVCLRQKDWACARAALERAVQIDPHSGHALLNLARLREVEGNPADAEQLLQRALSIEPTNPEVLALMAQTELLLRKYPEAADYARKVHAIPHTGLGVAHWIAAQALEAQGKRQEAVLEYATFLQEAPEHPLAPQARAALARLDPNTKVSTQRQ